MFGVLGISPWVASAWLRGSSQICSLWVKSMTEPPLMTCRSHTSLSTVISDIDFTPHPNLF